MRASFHLTALAILAGSAGCTVGADPGPIPDTTPGVSPPVDANPRRGPVVVGLDLAPADYGCLGADPAVAPGALGLVVVEVRDWSDGRAHADVTVRAASVDTWNDAGDCAHQADCTNGLTDAMGHTTLSLRVGPVWLTTDVSPLDAPHAVPFAWIAGLEVPAGATRLAVPSLSAATQARLGATGGIGLLVVGVVRDCAGAAVHRAHVRAFDASGSEVLFSSRGSAVVYATRDGNIVGDDRTTVDGVFVARPDQPSATRIEAWGLRALDGPEVLLGCRILRTVPVSTPTLVDVPPLTSDADPACGSRP